MINKSYRISIKGIVQGVGFRPFVYRLAQEYGIRGWVINSAAGVFIEAEGSEGQLEEFARRLVDEPPPLAVIRSCEVEAMEPIGYQDFTIRESQDRDEKVVGVSPDIAICADCRREVSDPRDRRYGYPFINCTNCGPRFTIIKDLPYDRAKTTMKPFPMCDQCREEYENPLHRRFHAQPNACPICGPHTTLVDRNGQTVDATPVELLKQGYIVAVKGLGAFHLAADATQPEVIKTLRKRKKRDYKPFAVMARDLEVARQYCMINPVEESWLVSPQAPIVVMQRNEAANLAGAVIHPGLNTLGVMLPYTPLHFLLFDQELELLIMTSANISDEPLIISNEDAIRHLGEVADFFLIHNRDIHNPCDDSVMQVTPLGTPQFMRRARGLVPRGIPLPVKSHAVLAVGGEMKSTFCITRQGEAYLSQHWGDLNHYGNYRKFLQGIERFQRMLAVEPQVIVHDLHPNYQTTRWAREQHDLPQVAVQHHYAHMASVMAENGLNEEVLGLICDGTGWGTDGAVWGCEILCGDYRQFSRQGHLQYMPLPGGDLTALRPYRMAFVYLMEKYREEAAAMAAQLLPALGEQERDIMLNRWQKGLPEIQTSSCGRLFDAVASLLGVCNFNQYEGQAAVELESLADPGISAKYNFNLTKPKQQWIMDVMPMWDELLRDLKNGIGIGAISQKFHLTLVEMFVRALCRVRDECGLTRVVLSGGVFHNQILLLKLINYLTEQGFTVYQHQLVPPGDGGISLGQAIIGSEVKA
ncbi:MAG: carbamoyltransferase HypF [Syntrophomonadaceae bacterium]|nr:carbamoyltransferase HypF [Syntrophomonadaceae bacterium]